MYVQNQKNSVIVRFGLPMIWAGVAGFFVNLLWLVFTSGLETVAGSGILLQLLLLVIMEMDFYKNERTHGGSKGALQMSLLTAMGYIIGGLTSFLIFS